MNISKTLFKNLSRCSSFSAYYDMYLNRFLHEVKEIDGLPITNNIVDEVIDLNLTEDDFSGLIDDKLNSIFSEMFDDETGNDLTMFTNAQMEAFKDTFTEVERLASIYIEELIGKKVIASTDTYSQKKYSYQIDGNTFYCYLDIYFEDEDKTYEYALVNPKIVSYSVKLCCLDTGEGCLSVPKDVEGYVYRYYKTTVKAFDAITNKEITIKARGYLSIILQHEIDHLEGKLYTDRIDPKDPFRVIEDAILI